MRSRWNRVSLLQPAGRVFSGYSDFIQSAKAGSLKLTLLANLGRATLKWLKASCLSKDAHCGSTTLFSSGRGKMPAKNSHSWSLI